MMMMVKAKTFFQFFIGIVLDIVAFSFLIFQIVSEINLESAAQKPVSTAVISLKEEKDPGFQLVLDILENIDEGKIQEALGQCRQLADEKTVPPKITEYFTDFYEFYGITKNPKLQKNSHVSTETFIKKTHYLQEYFQKTKYKDSWITFAEIVPYYFIRNYNSQISKNQKGQAELYRLYIDTLIEQYQYVSAKGGDVICLYFNARYYQMNFKNRLDIKPFIEEIEHFQEIYPNQLGETGSLREQKDYLKTVKEYLTTKLDSLMFIDPSSIFRGLDSFPKYNF